MTPEQMDGLSICLAIALMTLAVGPMLMWGIGERSA
jgi:hypothetical protein